MEVEDEERMRTPEKAPKRIRDRLQDSLPRELQFILASYLSAKDHVSVVQGLSVYWRQFVARPKLWEILNSHNPLSLSDRLLKTKCLVERRSKGRLYVAIDRISREMCTLRNIQLDITNAGEDDGLPTSVLREISHLTSLSHPNVSQIKGAQVKGKLVQLCFEHHAMNLKEFTRNVLSKEDPKIQLRRVKEVLFQVLEGIHYCHRNGVMHRNLKPDNILVTEETH